MAVKLYVLYSGYLKSTKDKFLYNIGIGEPFNVPVYYYLLDVDGTKLLIDTGMSPGCVEDPKATWGDIIDI
ncbi:MAG: hypothetical protein SVN78_10590 [Deferribacterota bacterium]|nr:hypothetical protein [Deferribacterota bacterium]